MLAPKKKTSLFRKHRRHSTWQTLNIKRMLKTYNFGNCKNCNGLVYSHRICNHCGYYNGKQLLTIKSKSKEKIIDA